MAENLFVGVAGADLIENYNVHYRTAPFVDCSFRVKLICNSTIRSRFKFAKHLFALETRIMRAPNFPLGDKAYNRVEVARAPTRARDQVGPGRAKSYLGATST